MVRLKLSHLVDVAAFIWILYGKVESSRPPWWYVRQRNLRTRSSDLYSKLSNLAKFRRVLKNRPFFDKIVCFPCSGKIFRFRIQVWRQTRPGRGKPGLENLTDLGRPPAVGFRRFEFHPFFFVFQPYSVSENTIEKLGGRESSSYMFGGWVESASFCAKYRG